MDTLAQKRWVNITDLNTKGILFGGKLLSWVDEDASILVAANTDEEFVTGRLMLAEFTHPARAGELLSFHYWLVHASHATITVHFGVYNEKKEIRIFHGYITFVAVKDGKPTTIKCKTKVPTGNAAWAEVERYINFLKEK